MSNTISRRENLFSLQLSRVDATGTVLVQRIRELLAARQVSRPDFGRAVKRGHSWISEFFSGNRTTNNLRLVIKIARFFGVSVGYLLGEAEAERDAETVTLLAAWRALQHSPRERKSVLQLAVSLSGLNGGTDTEGSTVPAVAGMEASERSTPRATKPRGRKSR